MRTCTGPAVSGQLVLNLRTGRLNDTSCRSVVASAIPHYTCCLQHTSGVCCTGRGHRRRRRRRANCRRPPAAGVPPAPGGARIPSPLRPAAGMRGAGDVRQRHDDRLRGGVVRSGRCVACRGPRRRWHDLRGPAGRARRQRRQALPRLPA